MPCFPMHNLHTLLDPPLPNLGRLPPQLYGVNFPLYLPFPGLPQIQLGVWEA